MAEADDIYLSVLRIVSDVTDVPEARLGPDSSFSDLNIDGPEFEAIYERACAEHGVVLHRLIETMPIYSVGADEHTMASLRNLAPFSARAAALLRRYDVEINDETIDSLAATIRSGVFVPSLRKLPPAHPAHSRFHVLAWTVGVLVLGLVLVPGVLGYLGQDIWRRETLVGEYQKFLPWTALFAAMTIGYGVVPGIAALRAEAKRRRTRLH